MWWQTISLFIFLEIEQIEFLNIVSKYKQKNIDTMGSKKK